MRILKLQIENLTTIAHAEIDFENGTLADHSLFLLTGPTGAGKTSILDAMTIALFGQAARLPNKKGKIADPTGELDGLTTQDTKRLARRGANVSSIELEFEGNDGLRYTAKWNVSKLKTGARANKAWGDAKRALVFPDGSVLTKDIDENIKRVINMDFGQFCQTTMLAQGDFTRFLKSDSNEKSAILEKILKVDIYTQISQRIYKETDDCKRRKELLDSEIQALNVMTPDEVANAEHRQAELKTLCENLRKQDADLQTKIKWLEDSQKAEANLQKSQQAKQAAKAEANSPAAAQENETVSLWDKTESLRQLLKSKEANDGKMGEESGKVGKFETTYIQNLSLLAARERTLTTEKANLDSVNSQIDSLKQNHNGALPQNMQEALEARKLASATKDKITDAKGAMKLHGIAAKHLSELQINQKEQEKKAADLKAVWEKAEEESQKANDAYNSAKKDLDDIVGKCDIAKELISKLHVGDRCPVCGGTVSEIKHDDEFESVKKPYAEKHAKAESANNAATKAKANAKSEYEANNNQLKLSQKEIVKASKQCEETLAKLKESANACGLAIDDLTDTAKAAGIIEQIEKEAAQNVAVLEQLLTLYTQKDKIEQVVKEAERQLKTARDNASEVKAIVPKWADRTANEIKDNPATDIANAWVTFKTQIEAWRNNIEALKAEKADCENAIKEEEQKSGVSQATAETLGKSQNQASITKLRAKIQDRITSLTQAQTALKLAQQQVEALKQNAPTLSATDTLETLCASKDTVNNRIGDANKEMGAISNSLKTDKENRKRRDEKSAELDKTKVAFEKWSTLNNFLGSSDGKKFRNIALSFILGELLHYANEHLRELTGNRFTLIGDGTLDILISDAYHGNAPQTPGNLSGGESFMVSLALALGLSSMAKLGNSGADILFIDEGFGTLDDDCLEKVMMMLERLKERGGKRVGIISHVDILRERIPTQIRVEPENASQSKVTVVG